MPIARTLLLSQDRTIIEAVQGAVASVANCGLEQYSTVTEVIAHIKQESVPLVLVHLAEGDDDDAISQLLREVAVTRRPIVTLVLSDRDCADQALRLLRLGVAECLSRPLDLGRLAFLVDVMTLKARHAPPAPAKADAGVQNLGKRDSFLYDCAAMRRVADQVQRVALQPTTILVTGETGTGKTRLARIIHELSPRRDTPLLEVNCAALSSTLIESEMFGHVKGAFTGADRDRMGKFAEAGSGTLLLDDIDALPLVLQAKLLRTVEERVFEPVGSNKTMPMQARLIAATNKVLAQEVEGGRFRADLFYRLNVVEFHLPPLRERRSLIRAMAEKFVADFSKRNGQRIVGLHSDALKAMQAYAWPGNIRELRNVMERAVALCASHQIHVDDLPDSIRPAIALSNHSLDNETNPIATLAATKSQAEVIRIMEALEKHGNNRVRAAGELGISRVALYKKLHKYGIMAAS